MNGLIDATLSKSRTVLTLMVLMVLAGLTSYLTIPKEADPDIPIPIFYVSIPHPGISPEDSERLLVKPIGNRAAIARGAEGDYRYRLPRTCRHCA